MITRTGDGPCKCKECEKAVFPVHFKYFKELTQERNSTNVNNVAEPSVVTHPFEHMKKLTLERNLMNVQNVGKPSFIALPFEGT